MYVRKNSAENKSLSKRYCPEGKSFNMHAELNGESNGIERLIHISFLKDLP